MKKVISMKPLAVATAIAAGATVSMVATALPGGDTLGAVGVVSESVCVQGVDVTIAGGVRTVTTGDAQCQLRTLPPTKGLVLSESTPAGDVVTDSSALVSAGGELYEAYVRNHRDAAVLLTPNRALSSARHITFTAGVAGSVDYDLSFAVQPSTGLQSSWLTGTYRIVSRNHNWSQMASGLERSVYAVPNVALAERNYTRTMDVSFNGDGTCTINDIDSHQSATLVKDPLIQDGYVGVMDVDCTIGLGFCGQNDGWNYLAQGVVNTGTTASVVAGEADWMDTYQPDGNGVRPLSCTYSIPEAGKITVSYLTEYGDLGGDVGSLEPNSWTETYDVSADLRYLVSDGVDTVDYIKTGSLVGDQKGGIAVGVRTGSVALEGKTYLFNALDATYSASTPVTPSYENPATPVYQEEECIVRGSLTLNAAGACTVDTASTCSGRNKSGYEETVADAGDGTISDSLTVFDGTPVDPPGCSWSGTASNLVINLDILDQEGNPVTVVYRGSASDNGETLALHGIYNVTGPVPDVQNEPLLPQMKTNTLSFLVAQQYQGSLAGDADADGISNFDEFLWAEGYQRAGRNDFTSDLTGDIYWYRPTDAGLDKPAGGTQVWEMHKNQRAAQLYPGNMTDLQLVPKVLADLDGNGLTDVIFHNSVTGLNNTWLSDNNWVGGIKGGHVKSTLPSTAPGYTVAGAGDFDGDGDADVLVRNATTGAIHAWLLQDPANCTGGACRVGESYLPVISGAFAVAAVADFDKDDVADILWYNSSNGSSQIWKMSGGVRVGVTYLPVINTAYKPVGASDTDGDGDADIVLHNESTGQVQIAKIENGARVGTSYPPVLPASFKYAGSADYNADGVEDLLWRVDSTGANRIWQMKHNDRIKEIYLENGHPALRAVY
jgi:hypothetical protein